MHALVSQFLCLDMPDPLSITAGIAGLLQLTWSVANELKKFHEGASIVHKSISDLLKDVDSFNSVLESMRDAFEHATAEQSSETGYVASLWNSIAQAIEDSRERCGQFQELMKIINKDASFLDAHRKQLRLNQSWDSITRFRVHIHSCRDSLQLSLQTIIFVNQTSQSKAVEDKVLPSLDQLHENVRRIALDLNQRIESLQSMIYSPHDETQRHVDAMANLQECVRSAASTISSATTAHTIEVGDNDDDSHFGNYFPAKPSLAMQRWLDSQTIYNFDEERASHVDGSAQSVARIRTTGSDDGADSDDELQDEIVSLLWEDGKQKVKAGNIASAEKAFQNCLGRIQGSQSKTKPGQAIIHFEVVTILYGIYHTQQRWKDAEEMLLQKLSVGERLFGKENRNNLEDVFNLAKVTKEQNNINAAQLHARRALKGYRKLGKSEEVKGCLNLLIILCDADGNENDKDAYSVMLETLSSQMSQSTVSQAGADDFAEATYNESLSDSLAGVDQSTSRLKTSNPSTADALNESAASSSYQGLESRQPKSRLDKILSRSPQDAKIKRKLVIVGDQAVGKTCLLISFAKGIFPDVYIPTVFENYITGVAVDGLSLDLELWDTTGSMDYDRLRPLSYPDTHVVLLCFSIDSPDSLDSIQEKWISEVLHFCPGLPMFLVGLKKDLRDDPKTILELQRTSQHPVTREQGMEVAQKIGALKYVECSAKTTERVKDVFELATRAALSNKIKKKRAISGRLFGGKK